MRTYLYAALICLFISFLIFEATAQSVAENSLLVFSAGQIFHISNDSVVYYDYEKRIPRFSIDRLYLDKFTRIFKNMQKI